MEIKRVLIPSEGIADIPGVEIIPDKPLGAVVIAHGYGGNKEEQLGLSWRIAEAGLMVCAIDMRGHGENAREFDEGIHADIEAAIAYCRKYGDVAAIGHSLGGRLALLSTADYAIGISPGIPKTYGKQTQLALKNLRCYRVVGESLNKLMEVMSVLPSWQPDNSGRAAIIYGSRDIPEIIKASLALETKGVPITEIEGAIHGDIFTLESTFRAVEHQLGKWFVKG